MHDRGFIGSLFDLSFSHFVTPRLQRILYVVLLVVSGLSALMGWPSSPSPADFSPSWVRF